MQMRIAALLLLVLTFAAFYPVKNLDFIHLDDDAYISENPFVQKGITVESVRWAFSADLLFDSSHADYWQPLTFFSRMLDVELFGMDPAGHHMTNLHLHLANVLILFSALLMIMPSTSAALISVIIFAAHPVQAETVAWVTARKDLLATFFGFLALWIYVTPRVSSQKLKQSLVLICYSLSLMSKPTLLTFPILLLVVDYFRFSGNSKINWTELIRNKAILFIPAVFLSITSLMGQREAFSYSGPAHILTAVPVTYVDYVLKIIFPRQLGPYAPLFMDFPSFSEIFASVLAMAVVTIFLFQKRNQWKLIFAGWIWFVIALLPSIALSTPADRYLYVAIIGAGWMFAGIFRQHGWVLFGLLGLVMAISSNRQIGFWKNDSTIFRRAIDVDDRNYVAHNNLGVSLILRGETEEATKHFLKSISLHPSYAIAYNNIGLALDRSGKRDEAIRYYSKALSIDPHLTKALYNMGAVMEEKGEFTAAKKFYESALRSDSESESARLRLTEIKRLLVSDKY